MQQWTRAPSGTQLVLQDFHATCYVVPFDCSRDKELIIKGEYPHARYMCFTVFSASGDAIASVYDRELVPDQGSVNPFQPGGHWDTDKRSYTLIIRFSSPPCGRPFIPGAGCNTIYTGPLSNEQPDSSLITYRIGIPSAGYDETGGAGVPQISSRMGSNTQETETAVCGAVDAARAQNARLREELVLHKLDRVRKSDIEWSRTDAFQPKLLQANTETVDIISGRLDGTPEKLLYLHWKAPTVPDTWHDIGFTGSEDVRCWSMTFLTADGSLVFKTISDYETVADQYGYVNLVVGFGAARPVFVTPSGGFSWISLSSLPPGPVSILYRNLMISPLFQYSANTVPIGSTVHPGLMGAYYPVGNYISLTVKDKAVI